MMVDWIVKNWSTKLVSLVLALGLWYYAVGEEGVEVRRTLPVEIKIDNEKMSIVGKHSRLVVATLEAPRSLLANLAAGELRAEHTIRKVDRPGDYSFRLEPGEVQLPSEKIRVVRVEPEVIQVRIDEILVQKLEVQPVFLGEPAFGYKLDHEKVQLDPRAVLVEGPKSQLEKIEKIKTQPIDVVGRVRSFRRTVRLAEEPGLKWVSETLIDVYVPIEELIGEKTFEKIPVRLLGNATSFKSQSIDPGQVDLVLRGSEKKLEGLEPQAILAYVDVTQLEPGTHEVPLQTVLPELTSLKDDPPVVKITLQK